jgi:cystathionine beta-lyase
MKYNFDEIIPRENTSCYKYDWRKDIFGTEDVIPMWVADMDLKTPAFIIDALKQRLEHEILGYTFRPDSFYESIINWNHRRNQWNIKKEWISFSPGIVPALNMIVMGFTEPGDKVVVQTPVYFPFFTAVTNHKRKLVKNPLKLVNGRYVMDFEHLERVMDEQVKLFILSSPHNPTGNVWHKEELMKLADICMRNNTIIVSDEIHSDLIFPGQKHLPLASISKDIAENTLTCMAPSKTFNLAGLSTSYIISSNEQLLKKFSRVVEHVHVGSGNIFGNIALEAAYNNGDEWVDELMEYLQKNVDYMDQFLKSNLPQIKMIVPEGTYLVWLDFRELNLSNQELKDFLIHEAKLGLSDGPIFGKDGSGFERINVGCPRVILNEAMNRLLKAFNNHF